MSFLSSFNILVDMVLGPTDLFELNEDIVFCICSLFGRRKYGVLRSAFQEIREMFVWSIYINLVFSAIDVSIVDFKQVNADWKIPK